MTSTTPMASLHGVGSLLQAAHRGCESVKLNILWVTLFNQKRKMFFDLPLSGE